jgi:hypothetical protein
MIRLRDASDWRKYALEENNKELNYLHISYSS